MKEAEFIQKHSLTRTHLAHEQGGKGLTFSSQKLPIGAQPGAAASQTGAQA